MGRPTLQAERREQILAAFCRCLAEHGLEGTTLDTVAAEAGVQRAAIRHFVGNRDQLIRAGADYLIERYEWSLESELRGEPGRKRVGNVLDGMFFGSFTTDMHFEDDAFDVLLAAAGSDDNIKRSIRDIYYRFEARLVEEISAAYPHADPVRITATAYAIMCMVEKNSTMRSLGFPPDRSGMARDMAQTLLEQLASH